MRGKKKNLSGGSEQNATDGYGYFFQAKQNRGRGAASPEQPCEEKHGSERPGVAGPSRGALRVSRSPKGNGVFRADVNIEQDSESDGESEAGSF